MSSNNDIDAAMRDAFSGNFMDATDLAGKGIVTVTIASVVAPNAEKDASGKVINKAIVAFDKASKRLILNKINAKLIALQHGTKPSTWAGKQIQLGVRYLEKAFGQSNVPVVRVIPPADKPMTFGMRRNFGSETPFTTQR